jgi:cytochrome c
MPGSPFLSVRLVVIRALVPMLLLLMFLTATPTAADAPAGDPARGAALYQQCAACHSVEPGLHLTGPSLAAIWNRRAGTVPGFGRYSEALKHAGLTWDAATLDRWLARPQAVVPETTMPFPGMDNARQRSDLIAYLKAVAEGKAPPTRGGGMMAMGPRSDLKKVGKERRVTAIRHCGDAYHVTTESGRTIPYWEFNLRFKTDSSPNGPEPGKPVLASAGMQGDRAQIVFASLDDLKRFIVERCEEPAR